LGVSGARFKRPLHPPDRGKNTVRRVGLRFIRRRMENSQVACLSVVVVCHANGDGAWFDGPVVLGVFLWERPVGDR